MRYFELTILDAGRAAQTFQAFKRFDPAAMMGPTLTAIRGRTPIRVDTSSRETLPIYSSLLRLMDELKSLGTPFDLVLNEGPAEVVDGRPVLTPKPGTREDVVRIVEEARIRAEQWAAEQEESKNYVRPPDPAAYTLLHERWKDVEFARLLPAEQNWIWIWCLKVEVENGSFHQYFYNSSGDDVLHAMAALEDVGAPRAAEMARTAIALFDEVDGYHSDRWERVSRLKRLPDEAFRAVTVAFWDRDEDVMDLALVALERAYVDSKLLEASQIRKR